MKLCVIGTGYVGLVTGSVLADLGYSVICADKDTSKISGLQHGIMPIFEPGLQELVERNVTEERLEFTTDVQNAVELSEVVFICVGTPPLPNGKPDMTYVKSAACTVAAGLNDYKIIVNKSTVPVGTADLVRQIIEEHRAEPIEFDVVSNPEFLREGSAISDTLGADRIVIGAPNPAVAAKMTALYESLERPILVTDVTSAEIIKYASNAFLATKISFINAIANLCEATEADIDQVIKGMGSDNRIGGAFLNAGLGYGGSCFPKDTSALVQICEGYGYEFGLLREVMQINAEQTERFMDRLHFQLDGFHGKTIGLLGLAFKPNTDDVRDAKSLDIIASLLAEGATVRVFDPIAMDNVRAQFPQITYCRNAYETAEDADALIVVTEWNEFKQLDMNRLRDQMRRPLLFDGRNIYDPARLTRMGFEYHGIGRGRAAYGTAK